MAYAFRRHHIGLMLVLLCTFTFLSYANVLNGQFLFDDYYTIMENDFIKDITNFFSADWIQLILSVGSRPVTDLTFALNYHWEKMNVFSYHLVNIFIHLCVTVIVYFFIRRTLRLTGEPSRDGEFLSLLVAALFALHPIQTQAVSYISQRAESLSALFYLCSLMLFISSLGTDRLTKKISLYSGGLALFVLSLGSKATAITLPASLLLYDLYFFKNRPLMKRLQDTGLLIAGTLIAGAIMLTRIAGSPYVGFSVKTTEPYHYLLTQVRVFVTYLRLIVLPVNQNLDYDYPVYRSFFAPEVFLSFLFLLLVLGLAVYLFRRSRFGAQSSKLISPSSSFGKRGGSSNDPVNREPETVSDEPRLISFGIIWFFILLLPSSVIPQRDVIFEHRAYLASLGPILSLTIAVKMLLRKVSGGHESTKAAITGVIICATILSVLAYATHKRNRVWQNGFALFSDVVSKSPGKPRAHYNLGTALLDRGNYEESLSEYRKALESKDDGSILRSHLFMNMGVVLLRMDRIDEAVDAFREGLALSPADRGLLDNLAIALKRTGRLDEAMKYARLSLAANAANSDMHTLIGSIYFEQRNYVKALDYYMNALKVSPDDPLVSWNIALALERLGRSGEASFYYNRYFSQGSAENRRDK